MEMIKLVCFILLSVWFQQTPISGKGVVGKFVYSGILQSFCLSWHSIMSFLLREPHPQENSNVTTNCQMWVKDTEHQLGTMWTMCIVNFPTSILKLCWITHNLVHWNPRVIERRGNRKMKNLTLSFFSFYISTQKLLNLWALRCVTGALVKSGVRRGGKGFSSFPWLVYLKHFQTSSLSFFWKFCPNLKALILLDISPNLKALILLNILLNLLMLLALHRWGIERGVGIDHSLTQSNQSYTHVSAFIVAHTTGYRICLQSLNTDKPRDKLKTRTAKILGKRRIRSLQSVGGHNPKKKRGGYNTAN